MLLPFDTSYYLNFFIECMSPFKTHSKRHKECKKTLYMKYGKPGC